MRRRTFLGATGLVASSPRALAAAAREPSDPRSPMKARDLNAYLRARIAVEEPSVDRITFGDPETVVRRIGTAWMPYWKTCRAAVAAGVNVLVVHEPAFYTHWDLDEKDGRDFYSAPEAGRKAFEKARDEKRAWLEANGLVLIRCHDVLDRLPEIGIPHAFGRLLGLEAKDLLRSKRFYDVLAVEPAPAAAVAGRLAERLRAVGQPGVAFYGDPERVVRSIGVGTGCICDPLESMEARPRPLRGDRRHDPDLDSDDVGGGHRPAARRGEPRCERGSGHARPLRAPARRLPGQARRPLPQGCGYRWIS